MSQQVLGAAQKAMPGLSGLQKEVGDSVFGPRRASGPSEKVKRRLAGRSEYEVVDVLAGVDQAVAEKTA